MTIYLLTFVSSMNKMASVRTSHEALLSELETEFNLRYVDPQHIDRLSANDFTIVFISSGGTERLVAQHFESLPRPLILLADGVQNSLAATLEIAAWVRSRGIKSEILHGEPRHIRERLHQLYYIFQAQKALSDKRIGVIGAPSSWLIASNVDYLLAKSRWGVKYVDIQLEDVYTLFDTITDDEVGEDCAEILNRALAVREGSPEEMLKAMRLYRAIRMICERERLDALTLSCFKLIERVGSTGCLAISLLNDDGIVAGCEGDLQAIFTLLAVQVLTGKATFMANPVMVNPNTNEVVFAHCTIGLKQTEQYIIRNHFESETGIGIQGILPLGPVTVVKCGGESLDEYYIAEGELTDNTNYLQMCRTQIMVKLHSSTQYFFKNPLGNHHIIVQGHYADLLHTFFQDNACKRIE